MAMTIEATTSVILCVVAVYVGVGLVFAIPFVWAGVEKLDSEAEGTSLAFRLLILPGVTAFWPMFLSRWVRDVHEPPVETNPHRIASRS